MSFNQTNTLARAADNESQISLMRRNLRPETVFRLKIAVFALFCALILLDSIYLIVCYITTDFFGWLNNPFFGWVRDCGWVAWLLYFPAFAGALLSIDTNGQAKKSRGGAALFLSIQMAAGCMLYFSNGGKPEFGLTLLYGPDVRMPLGNMLTYIGAIACLVPLLWVAALHIVSAWRSAGRTEVVNNLRIIPFLLTGASVFLLYAGTSQAKIAALGQPPAIRALAVSLAAHLAISTLIFLALAWSGVVARFFPDPGLARFALRAAAACLLGAVVLRKILFPLFGFNNHEADLHAALFSLAAVLAGSALILKVRQHAGKYTSEERPRFFRLNPLVRRTCALVAGMAFFYVFAVRFARIDWERAVASLAALGTALILFAFYWSGRKRPKEYSLWFLATLTLITVAAVWTVRSVSADATDTTWSREARQYADYDSSYFVIQQSLKPIVQDEEYAGFYSFLGLHANIAGTFAEPDAPLMSGPLARAGEKPNIVILVVDALRRDYLSPFNSDVLFTPNIEAFARDSVLFENAYTPYAGTILAEASIWKGHQQIHKVYPLPRQRVSNLQKLLEANDFDCFISYDEVLNAVIPPSPGITALSAKQTHWKENEFQAVTRELEEKLLQRGGRSRPVFAYAQPEDVHSLSLTLHHRQAAVRVRPGFNNQYASAVEDVDKTFGDFIRFLKDHGLYENSIVILTADHGESLGEAGREGHVTNLAPEVIRIPLVIHLPERLRQSMVWDSRSPVTLHDLTPTLYYLLGYRPLIAGAMSGHPLFTLTREEQTAAPDHFLLMSSYMAVFGVLSGDRKSLFMVDANLHRNYYYNLQDDPRAFRNRITASIRDHYEAVIRRDLEDLDRFYNLPPRAP